MSEKLIFKTHVGPVPPGYVKVSRWVGLSEVDLWRRSNSHIPNGIGRGTQVYVTVGGAPRPRSNVGPYRVDFFLPAAALSKAPDPDHRQIFGDVANTPIYNVQIFDCR